MWLTVTDRDEARRLSGSDRGQTRSRPRHGWVVIHFQTQLSSELRREQKARPAAARAAPLDLSLPRSPQRGCRAGTSALQPRGEAPSRGRTESHHPGQRPRFRTERNHPSAEGPDSGLSAITLGQRSQFRTESHHPGQRPRFRTECYHPSAEGPDSGLSTITPVQRPLIQD